MSLVRAAWQIARGRAKTWTALVVDAGGNPEGISATTVFTATSLISTNGVTN